MINLTNHIFWELDVWIWTDFYFWADFPQRIWDGRAELHNYIKIESGASPLLQLAQMLPVRQAPPFAKMQIFWKKIKWKPCSALWHKGGDETTIGTLIPLTSTKISDGQLLQLLPQCNHERNEVIQDGFWSHSVVNANVFISWRPV